VCLIIQVEEEKSLTEGDKNTEKDGDESSTTNGNHGLSSTLTKRNVTLKMLLTAGILKPGDCTVSLEYHVSSIRIRSAILRASAPLSQECISEMK